MKELLSSFLDKVQSKHWQNLQRKTQKLDRSNQENLLEFLEDHLAAPPSNNVPGGTNGDGFNGNGETMNATSRHGENNMDGGVDDDDEYTEEDYELLQRDIDKANDHLEELQSKHNFLETRLETYRSKIKAAEKSILGDPSSSTSPERLAATKEKIESYKKSLEPVEEIYQSCKVELASHELKIDSMHHRQMELKLKTQECRVVLEELSYNVTGREMGFRHDNDERNNIEADGRQNGDAAYTIECSSFGDDRSSNESDLENPQSEEEEEQQLEADAEKVIEITAINHEGFLSVPIGSQSETN
mmetsp:Transcript_24909/g.54764  ORF Transcript_24909/g.54764 Transcript_24909/m.54764 type:complete len:302 (+) Transcript_24909:110-1015(+)|eukprot:CAMPEP_0201147684 /NCGR_PEP_ID=MMETSP0851-20130426/9220_1 /ASSEMBLY_ACC=CAM_ASM_000631 /TAXON_ID=183588 /ORGANISM="Pseudo-nitzschia fraudulenta, Strain WWA7" /LENGTH=301 /DNA_ID=CAMNT_0047423605 /DNA_START=61 /DNA_END=966 /DNA_ORIENTATION=+